MLGMRSPRIIAGMLLAILLLEASVFSQDISEDIGPVIDVPPLSSSPSPGRTRIIDSGEVQAGAPMMTTPMGSPFASVPSEFPFVPFMLGDFSGPLANPMTDLKVAEGESPLPLDRVFYRFNMYSNMEPSRYQSLTTPYKRVNLYTNVFGFEKVFGQWVSVGFRLPINSIEALSRGSYYPTLPGGGVSPVPVPAPPTYTSTIFGNINGILKIKLVEDLNVGYMISSGFALSFPTATNQSIDPGPSTAAIFQPFLGYIYTRERFFFQGFTSTTLPLVTVQSMILFQDLGIGIWAYRNDSPGGFLTGIAPTFEMHLNVPLQGPQRAAWIFERAGLPFNTQLNLTFGGTFEFWHKAMLGMGLVVPTVGPIPFETEFVAQFNWRF